MSNEDEVVAAINPAHNASGDQTIGARTIGSLLGTADVGRLIPVVVGIVLVAAYASAKTNTFLTVGNMQNLLGQVAVLGVLTIGTMLLMIGGQIDLSIGSGVSLIAVVGAQVLTSAGLPEVAAAAVMLAMGMLIGLIIGSLVVTTGVQSFIVTLGLLSVFSALALIRSGSRPVTTGLAFAPIALSNLLGVPYSAVIFIALTITLAGILHFSQFGRRVFARGSNETAAYLAGVPVARVTVLLFVINGALVGCAAILFVARVGSGDPTGGTGLEIEAITAAVLGGATLGGGQGSMLGAFLSVILLGVIANALQIAGVPNNWAVLVYGAILIMAVTWTSVRERRMARVKPLED